MHPTSAGGVRIEFSANAELRVKLERCLDLSSHANPKRDLGVVIERAVDLLLAKLERGRFAKAERPRPHSHSPSQPGFRAKASRVAEEGSCCDTPNDRSRQPRSSTVFASRYVASAIRRFVFERDGSRCTYVSASGQRCSATAFLELDHIVPHAVSGRAEASNLRVRCRAHNRLWAEQAFGRARVERAVHLRQRKHALSTHDAAAGGGVRSASMMPRSGDSWGDTCEKVAVALRQMGFGHARALDAVRVVEQRIAGPQTLETFFREALLEVSRAA
jgi:hypothetical protein